MREDTIWTRSFILLACGNLLMAISFYFLIPTLPIFIEQVLKADKTITGLIIATYSIAALLIRPFTGKALDTLGRKTIFLFSFLLFSLLFNVYVFAVSIAFIAVLRFFHGLAWGMVSTSNSTLVVDMLPVKRRGEGIGYFGLSMTLGMALGPMIGIWIAKELGYDALFLWGGALAFSGFILAVFAKYPKFIRQEDNNKFSAKTLFERKSLPASLVMYFLMVSYGGLLSFVAIYGKEIGVANPGIFFIAYAIGISISRFFSGRIFDKYGPVVLNFTGMGLLLAGFPLLALVQNIQGFIISAGIMGFANGIIFPTFQAMVNNLVPYERRGAANSTYFTAIDLGIGTGMILMGVFGDLFTLSYAYLLSAIFVIAGILITWLLAHPHYLKNKM